MADTKWEFDCLVEKLTKEQRAIMIALMKLFLERDKKYEELRE